MTNIGSEPFRNGPESPVSPRALVSCVHADTREMLRLMLEAWGFDVTTADGKTESIGAAGASRPDIVILDAGFPFPETLETVEELKACLDGSPILLISGFAHEYYRRAAIDSGAADYLIKPVDFDTLQAEILRLIRESQKSR